MNKTERIAGFKLVNTAKGPQFIVTTVSGAQVWVPQAQFDTSSQTITYHPMKAGDTYTDRKTGEEKKRKEDGNNFVCVGKLSSIDLAEFLISRGEKVIINA